LGEELSRLRTGLLPRPGAGAALAPRRAPAGAAGAARGRRRQGERRRARQGRLGDLHAADRVRRRRRARDAAPGRRSRRGWSRRWRPSAGATRKAHITAPSCHGTNSRPP
jgi:hypothetical protein